MNSRDEHPEEVCILIVDDDPGTIRVLSQILKDVGKIHFTTNSNDALALAQTIKPDFILLDVEMPDIDGINLCKLIKGDPCLIDSPILVVSSHTDMEVEARAFTAGAADFIHKPPHPLAVKARVKNYIALKQRTEQLRKFAQAIEQSMESVIIIDTNFKIEFINDAFLKKTGCTKEELIGKAPDILESENASPETLASLWAALTSGRPWKGEFYSQLQDGSDYVELATITPIRQGAGKITHYLLMLEDVTAYKDAQRKLHKLAYFDVLTHLPNRLQFLDRLRQELSARNRQQSYGALLLIDLDNFKLLNDTQGHEMGDALLVEVSQRLRTYGARSEDFLARLGGDEFVILLNNLPGSQSEVALQAEIVANKILRALDLPVVLNGIEHVSTASIGIYLYSGAFDETVDSVLKLAEAAMYRAKSKGRNRLCFFDANIHAILEKRACLETELRKALPLKQLQLFFQPQYDLNNDLIGAEALLRWQHPELGMVSPAEFIALAEETGLIVQMGLWVLQSACLTLFTWNSLPGWEKFHISVNVSACQFSQSNFVNSVRDIVFDTGISAGNLKLELTESVFLDNVEDCIDKMQTLRELGIRFSMDDFGTGYSSLAYLKRLPLDELKIDQSFVRDIDINTDDEVIIQTIIVMGKSLGLVVIAEGVETDIQKEHLLKYGCNHFQGYLFGRPQTSNNFEQLLRRQP